MYILHYHRYEFNVGLKQKKFKVLNYKTLKAYDKSVPVAEGDFQASQFKIAYAIARTLCSHHLNYKELYFDIMSSFFSIMNLFNYNGDYLQLKQSRLNRLRDFSRTSRIGELAQAVSYLFIQERLGFPYIIDFHLYCEKYKCKSEKLISNKRSKSPDFVILNSDLQNIGLYESKGISQGNTNIKSLLKKALEEQLEIILKPKTSQLIPVCTQFGNENSKYDSSINYHFKKIGNSNSFDKKELFRQHYASWFYLVGDFNRASKLLDNQAIDSFDNQNSNDSISYQEGEDDKNNVIYWVEKPLFYEIRLDSYYFGINFKPSEKIDFKIGIDKKVVSNLVYGSYDLNIDYPPSNERYLYFSDGIVIQIREEAEKIKL